MASRMSTSTVRSSIDAVVAGSESARQSTRYLRQVGANALVVAAAAGAPVTVTWLEWDYNGGVFSNGVSTIGSSANVSLGNLLLHGGETVASGSKTAVVLAQNSAITLALFESFVYGWTLDRNDTNTLTGVSLSNNSVSRVRQCFNTVIHGLIRNQGTGTVTGLLVTADNAGATFQNVVATGLSGTTFGTKACFVPTASAVRDHNASDDTTADGTGSLASIDPADQYVSTVVGSEDLHLKSGADCIDAGVDLGTTPTGVNIDINGRDRDAQGDVWDIGAHEFVAAGGGSGNPWYYYVQQ